jgi:glycosyltransferase involved in cell wall biosynthesis
MISVFIVTKNEEHNIERALKSVKMFDEIVVVDSGSDDRTVELAKKHTDLVFHHDWTGMAEQKQYAKEQCTNEWVLNIDADEEATPELVHEILELTSKTKAQGISIPIREFFLHKASHELTKKNAHVRLFKREAGHYGKERFHETPSITGAIIETRGCINHYGDSDISFKMEKLNKYSTGKAQDKFEKGKKASIVKLLLVFPVMFLKNYLLKRNCLNGKRGFIGSIMNAFYAFLKEAKLYELYLKQNREK